MTPAARTVHLPQLDGLRAFAVGAVLLAHFLPEHAWLGRAFPWGQAGVRLFFVLSGYLITDILLRGRELIEAGRSTLGGVAKVFYARRFLRIFPLYYATLTALVLVMPQLRRDAAWYYGYLENLLIFRAGRSIDMAHFWSLAVEEQFYLLWPWLTLGLPRRLLLPGLLALVALGPATRAVALALGYNAISATVLMPACLDTLGVGALLALLAHRGMDDAALARLGRAILAAGLLIWAPFLASGSHLETPAHALLVDLAMALVFGWAVLGARRAFSGVAGRVLASPLAAWVGKISYGVYVLHLPVHATLGRL